MTEQEIVAGHGDIAQASGTLGLNIYAEVEFRDVLQTCFSSSDLGEGPGAVAWLAGSFFGGDDAIAQLWDNNGRLGLNLYYSLGTLFSFPDLGQGSGAVAWLTGDFTGSGQTEIAQLWDNGGNLGLNVYRMAGDTVQTVINSSDLGQGSGAVAWLTLDFTGSGHTQIAQLWDNGGNLGLNVYRYRDGAVYTALTSSDLGQGTGAVAWLTGDFLGRGLTQIAQLWDNDGTLGAVIYGGVNGSVETLFGSSDLGQGSGAVAWLTGNFIGSGTTEIAQLWDNQGTLSCLLYTFSGGSPQRDPFTGDLGQGAGALAWLTGNFTGSGLTAIAQPWAS